MLAGSDYVPFDPVRLTFTPGGPSVLCEPLIIRVDEALEGIEVVKVTVSSTQVTIGPQDTVTINILDSNSMSICVLVASSYNVHLNLVNMYPS